MRPEHRTAVVNEVVARIVERVLQPETHELGPIPSELPAVERVDKGGALILERPLPTPEQILMDTLYHERRRLEGARHTPTYKADKKLWDRVARRLPRAGETEVRALLRAVVEHFAHEIVGNFRPQVYDLATRVLPPALSLLLHALSPRILLERLGRFEQLTSNIFVQGEVEAFRGLRDYGTLLLVPTHLSNLDSIVVGWALHDLGMPPFTYGAGINLFSNPLISFFMNNLGAYKVDRTKKAPLYKETLKEYATVTIETGYDNLFFPGGTRSRSGHVERRLKLGLLGTGLRAYINNLKLGKDRPNIYVVPCTINFQLVLEAETLIEDHLMEEGKSRFIIEDDEFSQPRRVFDFISHLMSLDARVEIALSRPLDPFGNPVDDEGRSLDPQGRSIDIRDYVVRRGRARHDPARDAEYTRELGEEVRRAYWRDNVVFATHAAAFTVFRLLQAENPGIDLFRLLRTGGRTESFGMREVEKALDRLLASLIDAADRGRLRLDRDVRGKEASEVLADALRYFGTYHTRAALERRGDRLFMPHRQLLYYYHNRLDGYGFDKVVGHRGSEGGQP